MIPEAVCFEVKTETMICFSSFENNSLETLDEDTYEW